MPKVNNVVFFSKELTIFCSAWLPIIAHYKKTNIRQKTHHYHKVQYSELALSVWGTHPSSSGLADSFWEALICLAESSVTGKHVTFTQNECHIHVLPWEASKIQWLPLWVNWLYSAGMLDQLMGHLYFVNLLFGIKSSIIYELDSFNKWPRPWSLSSKCFCHQNNLNNNHGD